MTDFPKKGDDKSVSLRNSNFDLFDRSFAERIKEQYPDIWDKGGNIEGNNQYRRLISILEKGSVETETDEMAVRKREAWAARHFENKNIAGVIAQVKWLVVGSRGEKYMKDLINEEINKNKRSNFMEKELKKFNFSLKAIDDERGIIEAIASSNNMDRTEDIIAESTLYKAIENARDEGLDRIPMKYMHSNDKIVGSFPVNEMSIVNGMLNVKGRINLNTQLGKDCYELVKAGDLPALSVGIYIYDAEFKDGVRIIKDMFIFEISLVDIPANRDAQIQNIKAATPYKNLPLSDSDTTWDKDSAIERVREFTNSQEKPSSKYRDAFFWYNQNESDLFGSYKLPFADVIDGRLQAVPRAIFAAAAAINGARGGVDIPENDLESVKNNIERYYNKMEKESPFSNKKFTKDDMVDIKSVRDVEAMLKSAGFSNEASKHVISVIKSDNQAENLNKFVNDLKDFVNN